MNFKIYLPNYIALILLIFGCHLVYNIYYMGVLFIIAGCTIPIIYAILRKIVRNKIADAAHIRSSNYDYILISVADVKCKNGRIRRQSILRKIKEKYQDYNLNYTLSIKKYELNNKLAFGIYVNDEQLGNIPDNMFEFISENFNRIIEISCIDVHRKRVTIDDFSRYGAFITLKLEKKK